MKRWTKEDLDAYAKRMQGNVTTHKIERSSQSPKRTSKYGNVKAEADGQIFASKRERGRWMDLRLEEKAEAIRDLKRQVQYPLVVNGIKVCDYFADFEYLRDGKLVTEDSKGYRTETYLLKKNLMFAVHGVEIVET